MGAILLAIFGFVMITLRASVRVSRDGEATYKIASGTSPETVVGQPQDMANAAYPSYPSYGDHEVSTQTGTLISTSVRPIPPPVMVSARVHQPKDDGFDC